MDIQQSSQNVIDLQLISAVKDGHKEAFDSLVLRYQYKVLKIVSKYVHDSGDVLDIVQETFIKAYKSLDRFRGDSSFYTWLYRIAVNTSKSYLISKYKHGIDFSFEMMEQYEPYINKDTVYQENNTPDNLAMRHELEDIFFMVVDKLPDDLKTAIMLREVEELTYEEIASVMGCPVGTVRSRIFRAREMIERKAAISRPPHN